MNEIHKITSSKSPKMEIRDKNLPSSNRYNTYSDKYKAQNSNNSKYTIDTKSVRESKSNNSNSNNNHSNNYSSYPDNHPTSNNNNKPNNFGSVVNSRKAKKIEKIILVIIYIVVILIAIYFILASFFPSYLPFSTNTYTIKASDSKIFSLSSFYIDDPSVLGDVQKMPDGTQVRPIVSSKKFNFIFKPKKNIPQGQNATFTLNLVLNQSNPGPVYINDQLIFPDLTNYQLLKETPTDYIYVNNDIMKSINKNNFKDADTTEDYIYKNLPGSSVWSTRQLAPVSVNVPDYKAENTLVNGTFRGDLKLAVYAQGSLVMNFKKQDLNSYLGEDTYNLIITNSNGDVVYNKTFADDGDKLNDNKLGKEQFYSFGLYSLKSDIYYINFQSDKNNDATDSSLKDININSNKVLIIGTFLPWDKFDFYTKIDSTKNIGFLYWWAGKDQIINVTGTQNKKINLNINWLNLRYDENLTKGEYTITTPKGYVWIYNDISSPSKSSWFPLPYNQQQNFNKQNVVVIDKSNFNQSTEAFSYNQYVDTGKTPVKINLRTLNSNSASFSDAKLSLK
jgi:hypothetical protein